MRDVVEDEIYAILAVMKIGVIQAGDVVFAVDFRLGRQFLVQDVRVLEKKTKLTGMDVR